MAETLWIAVPVALAMWWGGTGIVFALGSLTQRFMPFALAGATLAMAAAMVQLATGSDDTSTLAAITGFACGIAVWGWIELTFLSGLVTGPRRVAIPADSKGWRRFALATATLLYHEVLIVLAALTITALTWGGANQVGILTFAVLMALRLSAKLNLFLGVPSFSDEMMPERLAYLRSCFRRGPASKLFPLALLLASGAAAALFARAAEAPPGSGAAMATALPGVLLLLGIVEHLFMILPVRDSALWRWFAPRAGGAGQ